MSEVKFIVPFVEFMPAIECAIKTADASGSSPIKAIENVYLTAFRDRVVIMATDRYRAIMCALPSVDAKAVKAVEETPLLINAASLTTVLKAVKLKRRDYAKTVVEVSYDLGCNDHLVKLVFRSNECGHVATVFADIPDIAVNNNGTHKGVFPPVEKVLMSEVGSGLEAHDSRFTATQIGYFNDVVRIAGRYSDIGVNDFPITLFAGIKKRPHLFRLGDNIAGAFTSALGKDANNNVVLDLIGYSDSKEPKTEPKPASKPVKPEAKPVKPEAMPEVKPESKTAPKLEPKTEPKTATRVKKPSKVTVPKHEPELKPVHVPKVKATTTRANKNRADALKAKAVKLDSKPASKPVKVSKAKAVAPVAADSVPTDSTAIDKTLSMSAKALRKFLYRTFRAKGMHVYRNFETNAVRIAWTGGPSLEEVADVAKRFTVGHDGHAIRSFKLERA